MEHDRSHGTTTDKQETICFCLHEDERRTFFPDDLKPELRALDCQLLWRESPKNTDELIALLNETQTRILVGSWSLPPLPKERQLIPTLECYCHVAGDIRGTVPLSLIREGFACSNWGNSIGRVVAEHALLLVLMCLRQASDWTLAMHCNGAWKNNKNWGARSLFGRRVGIHGFGGVARGLVRLLGPFGCQIAACSDSPPDDLFAQHGVTRLRSLDELFDWADIVVEAEVHNEQTERSVREKHLRALGDGVFVNVGRAALVDEAALLKVANEGKLRIGLDVYHVEPLPVDSSLRNLPSVCLFPHIGGPTLDRRIDAGRYCLKQVKAFLCGKIPKPPHYGGHSTSSSRERHGPEA
ncbi:MAG: hydroxyacid dehydrogenase [Candidatus Pacebacteria bacterium]|nr:hydroxyacid dehydrogenase [Candidatus Paceibacterota bacterium]